MLMPVRYPQMKWAGWLASEQAGQDKAAALRRALNSQE